MGIVDLDALVHAAAWYFLLIVLVLWGYTVDYIRRVKLGDEPAPSLRAFLLDVPGALLTGYLAYITCQYYGLPNITTTGFVAVAGHIGGKGVYWVEKTLFALGDAGLTIGRVKDLIRRSDRP
jgi:hypothetical protein